MPLLGAVLYLHSWKQIILLFNFLILVCMKTKALLISTLCLLGANYSWAADEDVTPGHLKFADQAVGSYEFEPILFHLILPRS